MLVWVRKVRGKAEATVQMLLDRGANVNACEPEEFVTPIMAAVEEESEESLRIVSQCHFPSLLSLLVVKFVNQSALSHAAEDVLRLLRPSCSSRGAPASPRSTSRASWPWRWPSSG